MKSIVIELPDQVDAKKAITFFAAKMYESGELSLGQAAEMAGYSKSTFMELLGDFGVSVFNYSAQDIEQELQHVRNYHS